MSAPAVQQMMEGLMNTTYQKPYSPTLRGKFEEGEAKGWAKAVEKVRATLFRVMESRSLTPTDKQRSQVETCADLDTLYLWIERSATESSTDDIFK